MTLGRDPGSGCRTMHVHIGWRGEPTMGAPSLFEVEGASLIVRHGGSCKSKMSNSDFEVSSNTSTNE